MNPGRSEKKGQGSVLLCYADPGETEGGAETPLPQIRMLHFLYFYTLVWAYFDATHAPDAFCRLVGIGLAVGPHLINAYRADVDTLATAGAAVHVHID